VLLSARFLMQWSVMMIRFLMIVPALTVGLAASATAQQVSEQDARQAGQSVIDAWNKTELQKDAVAHAALFTEDAVQVTSRGLISGRAAIERRAVEEFKVYTPDPSKLEQVKMIGSGVMLRAGTWSGTYNGPHGPVQLKGYWSDTDVRDGDTWKIQQETSNVTPPPP
jgi:uncharacterized protein (TIGR02246 family)